MRLALGLYTQTAISTPKEVFARALSSIIKKVFTYVYNNEASRLSFGLSTQMIKYLAQNSPEVNLLISSLSKNSRVELFTSAYNHAILSLMQVKNRSYIIDKNTTLIRKTYGVRATSLWCYGEIWSPAVINTMKMVGLERVIISTYNAITKRPGTLTPFRMNELGRKIDIIPTNDFASKLVSSYAQNEISLDELIARLLNSIENQESDLVYMINLDQLCQGASYNREDDEKLYQLFTLIFDKAIELGVELVLPKELTCDSVGYLDNAWYGRDASAGSLSSFQEIFVKNQSFRYYLNRVNNLIEIAAECKDRIIKRSLSDKLATILQGTLFLCDTNASALRLAEHRAFYNTLLDCEYRAQEADIKEIAFDLDDDSYDELFAFSRSSSAIFAPRGGAVYEYNSKELLLSIFDTVSPWKKDDFTWNKKRSFVDEIYLNKKRYDLKDVIFELDHVNKNRTEYNFVYFDNALPFQITKHYKLSNQNLYLGICIYNTSDDDLVGLYNTTLYFTLPEAYAYNYDAKRGPLMGESLTDIKSVRFSDSERFLSLSITSSVSFSIKDENRYQSEITPLGSEQFYLYTKAKLTFSLNIKKGVAATFNIVAKIENKEKNNVFTQ